MADSKRRGRAAAQAQADTTLRIPRLSAPSTIDVIADEAQRDARRRRRASRGRTWSIFRDNAELVAGLSFVVAAGVGAFNAKVEAAREAPNPWAMFVFGAVITASLLVVTVRWWR